VLGEKKNAYRNLEEKKFRNQAIGRKWRRMWEKIQAKNVEHVI
jgi:hypothetical protein